MTLLALAAAALLAVTPMAFAPAPVVAVQPQVSTPAERPVDAAERAAVVGQLATALETSFVFPRTGARYAAMLRANLAGGAYDRLSHPAAFAERVTGDLQAVAKDGHLRLALRSAFAQRAPPPPDLL